MAAPFGDEEQEKPLDPAVERVRRKLVRFVAINLGLLFLALMAVVAAIVYRAGRSEEQPPVAAAPDVQDPVGLVEGEIALPAGARIAGHSLSGNRVSLLLELAGGGRTLLVYDVGQGHVVGRFSITGGEP